MRSSTLSMEPAFFLKYSTSRMTCAVCPNCVICCEVFFCSIWKESAAETPLIKATLATMTLLSLLLPVGVGQAFYRPIPRDEH